MTNAQKLRTLLAILECAPAARATTVFESARRSGNLSLFWKEYQLALQKSRKDDAPQLESREGVTLAMLEPAMKAVYDLPSRDDTRATTGQTGQGGRSGIRQATPHAAPIHDPPSSRVPPS